MIVWQQVCAANQRMAAAVQVILFGRECVLSEKQRGNHWPPPCIGSGCRTPPERPCFRRPLPGSFAGAAPTCFGELCEAADTGWCSSARGDALVRSRRFARNFHIITLLLLITRATTESCLEESKQWAKESNDFFFRHANYYLRCGLMRQYSIVCRWHCFLAVWKKHKEKKN